MNSHEQSRLTLQATFDAAKTQTERNKLGQYATPTTLAADIIRYALALLPPGAPIRFLDPAFGTGSFYSALLQAGPASRISRAAGYEIDPLYQPEVSELWGHTGLQLHFADFTRQEPPSSEATKPNLLVCNPPYVRHHHLSSVDKARLGPLAFRRAGVELSGLAGLYCYFLLIAHSWMADGGWAIWLIPSEFMDVNYGAAVKEYLLNRVSLLHIHRFDPADAQFDDADVSSAVVVFKNTPPPPDHSVELTYGGTLAHPRISRRISSNQLRLSKKWSALPVTPNDARPAICQARLSDIFDIKRGIATGANGFFILTLDEACQRGIPARFLTPVLPSPRYLSIDEVQTDSSGYPVLDQHLVLLTCDRGEEEVRDKYPSLWNYLQQGVDDGVSQRYLCKSRTPWYAQERRPPAPILCSYMGRQDTSTGRPFRFILNHSRATAANVYLMLYPKPNLARAIAETPSLLKSVWQALCEIPLQTLIDEGRVYGGGLHKLEPGELANAPAGSIVEGILGLTTFRHHQLTLLESKPPILPTKTEGP